jgi:dihydrofolate reductase
MMSKVFAEMTATLDGFIAGPEDGPEFPLGRGGQRIHEWLFSQDVADQNVESPTCAEIAKEASNRSGAVIIGKRMFACGGAAWGDTPPFGLPIFVLTHEAHEPVVKHGGERFTFVADGIEPALDLAREAANGKDVWIGGGANVVQQYLQAGLLDELQIHFVPVIFGNGRRLLDCADIDVIELVPTRTIAASNVTHITYRLAK